MKREEAARILEKQFDKSCGNYRYQNKDKLDYEDALWMAISSLRELEAQEKQKPFGEWISVKDRLPETGERVLTLDKWGHIRDRELFRFKSGFICFRPDGLVPVKDITHWMPMPEPQKEEV